MRLARIGAAYGVPAAVGDVLSGRYGARVSGGHERPSWAFSGEIDDKGQTVFRDDAGERLFAIAFTQAELSLLRYALEQQPQSSPVRELLSRLDGPLHDA